MKLLIAPRPWPRFLATQTDHIEYLPVQDAMGEEDMLTGNCQVLPVFSNLGHVHVESDTSDILSVYCASSL
jgi:hypothetical protein